MKRAFPAYLGDEVSCLSRDEAVRHYEAKGFKCFDGDSEWTILRKDGVLEAYVRRANVVEWRGSVVQIAPCPIGDCTNQSKPGHEPCYRGECGQINSFVACDMPRVGNERVCPDCNPRPQ